MTCDKAKRLAEAAFNLITIAGAIWSLCEVHQQRSQLKMDEKKLDRVLEVAEKFDKAQ